MSEISPILGLPYIQAAQAQKHVTHNEALRVLDSLTQIGVEATVSSPPQTPAAAARYLVAPGATEAFAGQDTALAQWEEGAWVFYPPQMGWQVWDNAAQSLLIWDGTQWKAVGQEDLNNRPGLGIAASYDATNRLTVASDAVLLTHAGAGHQVKVNKSAANQTASLLFQTDYSGRAEMGTAGADDFEIKTSADGTTFQTALRADAATGQVSFPSGVSGLTEASFGTGPLLTTNYAIARGVDLVTNGSGILGNGYNSPASYSFDPSVTPGLPASFAFGGYYPGLAEMSELVPVDPNQTYRLQTYIYQEGAAGDWSGFAHGERHQQFMGLLCYDADQNPILANQHMRYRHDGVDSLTTLAAPLAPGDTVVQVVDASGWNDSSNASTHRGIILFGYQNSFGYRYPLYSRLVSFNLFDLAGVDKATGTITLQTPWPASLGNPDDPSGVWPAGTRLANSTNGGNYKYSLFSGLRLAQTDQWYHCENHMGGMDHSGTNRTANFPPGTAYARVFWLPNYSNRPGGWSGNPDTGANHRVLFSGISVTPAPLAVQDRTDSGTVSIKVPRGDFQAGTLSLVNSNLRVTEV